MLINIVVHQVYDYEIISLDIAIKFGSDVKLSSKIYFLFTTHFFSKPVRLLLWSGHIIFAAAAAKSTN